MSEAFTLCAALSTRSRRRPRRSSNERNNALREEANEGRPGLLRISAIATRLRGQTGIRQTEIERRRLRFPIHDFRYIPFVQEREKDERNDERGSAEILGRS